MKGRDSRVILGGSTDKHSVTSSRAHATLKLGLNASRQCFALTGSALAERREAESCENGSMLHRYRKAK